MFYGTWSHLNKKNQINYTGLHGFVMEQLRYISEVIFGTETESGLRIAPSSQVYE